MTAGDPDVWCATASLERDDPIEATASRVSRWLLVEHRGAWGPESVPSSRMPVSVARSLAEAAAAARARLLLVRRPAGVPGEDGRWVFTADSRPGYERVLARHVEDDRELAALVPSYEPGEGWQVHAEPLLLVCTHGRNDRCCATRGRPVARALAKARPRTTWECSHVGGDRFAANVVVLPDGLYLGRVEATTVVAVVQDLEAGVLPLPLVRGRSSLPLPTQAAQHFARSRLARPGSADLALVAQHDDGPDRWRVELSGDVQVVVRYDRAGSGTPAVLSCGDPPRVAPVFRLVSLDA